MTDKPSGRGGARPGAGRKPKAQTPEIKPAKNQTAATPNKRGGARPGAGRKAKDKPAEPKVARTKAVKEHLEPQPRGGALKRTKSESVEIPDCDMLTMLKDVALGRVDATALQVRAAIAAVQYTHTKKGDGGKKDEEAEKAKKAGAGKFASAPPPKLVAAGGKKV